MTSLQTRLNRVVLLTSLYFYTLPKLSEPMAAVFSALYAASVGFELLRV